MRLFRKSRLQDLAVTMAGVKLGDRVLVVGCGDVKLIANLAIRAGLTGRACALDESAERSAEAARFAHAEGALIETMTAPFATMPFDASSFDVVVVRDVLTAVADNRLSIAREVWRVLRPGGRCVVVQSIRRRGLAGVFGARSADADTLSATRALEDAEFRGVRILAEREGLAFVEAIKPVT
jgi:ubiquinone/menaquinone biosynthesis C-methylase UbiE